MWQTSRGVFLINRRKFLFFMMSAIFMQLVSQQNFFLYNGHLTKVQENDAMSNVTNSNLTKFSDVIANQLKHYINLEIGKLAQDGVDPDILCWSLKNDQNTENSICVYLGLDNQSFFNISMTMKCRKWLLFDTEESKLKDIQSQDTKWLKKRYYYIEKCKDAQQLGIVVGTLSTKGYLDMVKHIQVK